MGVSATISMVLVFLSSTCLANGNMGYGAPVSVLSGAGSSSRTGSMGNLARSNTGSYNSGNTVQLTNNAPGYSSPIQQPTIYTYDTSNTDDNTDDSSSIRNMGSSNTGILAGASSNSASGMFAGNRGAGSNVNAFSIGGGNGGFVGTGNGGNNVQVVQVDSSSMQDINSQIQGTIQNILRKFGITFQPQNFGVGGMSQSYQPGRSFVIQSNGDMSQQQYQGGQQQSQSMTSGNQGMTYPASNGFNQAQVGFSAAQPVVVSYRVVANPGQTNSLAFSIMSGADQDSTSGAVGSSASASNTNAGSGFYDSGNNGGANSVRVQTGQQQQGSSDSSDQYSDQAPASSGGYSAPVPVAPKVVPVRVQYPGYGASAAVTPAPSRQGAQQIRYVAQTSKKTDSNSNVAYEQDSS